MMELFRFYTPNFNHIMGVILETTVAWDTNLLYHTKTSAARGEHNRYLFSQTQTFRVNVDFPFFSIVQKSMIVRPEFWMVSAISAIDTMTSLVVNFVVDAMIFRVTSSSDLEYKL